MTAEEEEDKLGDAFVALEECVTRNPDHGPACKELARLSNGTRRRM